MLLMVQISAAQGPQECERAVAITLRAMLKDAEAHGVKLQIVEDHATPAGHKSVLLQARSAAAAAWLVGWEGSVQCTFSSPFRPGHRRKNWFVGVQRCEMPERSVPLDERDIVFQACRASGKGGQHVNTTDSAVHAVHTPSGIAVKVMTERSQHANKRLACVLIAMKLKQQSDERCANARRERSQQHGGVERGNPVRCLQA